MMLQRLLIHYADNDTIAHFCEVLLTVTLKTIGPACPHLFPKQATLYPEAGDFVAVSETKSPVSGYRTGLNANPNLVR